MKTFDFYRVPESINVELENWARWCLQDGALPHPLPSTQAPFARFVITDQTTAWENRRDEHGDLITVSLDDEPVHQLVDSAAAQSVQKVYDKVTKEATRRVWNAEYIGFGAFSFVKHPIRRDLAAQRIGYSLTHYEAELQNVVDLIEGKQA